MSKLAKLSLKVSFSMMNTEENRFTKGIIDGIPICLGYLAVAFAFGIFSVGKGLSVLETVAISMTNLTSAGQLAAVPVIASGGTLVELALTQLVINFRYVLMSVSLSQKLGKGVRLLDRFWIAFGNTDEIFAVSSSKKGEVGRRYMAGLILTPYIGWSLGTFLGGAAGNILPKMVISSLELAIYGMFIAIVAPQVKKNKPTLMCVALAVLLSCLFCYLPYLNQVPSGFTVIICAVISSAVFAYIVPIPDLEEAEADYD